MEAEKSRGTVHNIVIRNDWETHYWHLVSSKSGGPTMHRAVYTSKNFTIAIPTSVLLRNCLNANGKII